MIGLILGSHNIYLPQFTPFLYDIEFLKGKIIATIIN
jgi:hypothetical protein